MRAGFTYFMANRPRGKTYLGVTNDLARRAYEHRNALIEGYSKKNGCCLLVWYERFENLQEARDCEYRMKSWHRPWKLRLIEEFNPEWRDLYDDVLL